MTPMLRLRHAETSTAIALIVAVAGIAYAPLLAGLGFYWDDWFFLWVGHSGGATALADSLAADRPAAGILYGATYALLGNNPLHWHLYSFAMRVLGALLLLWTLRRLWPGQRALTTGACLLYVVYPGFLQQPVAQVYHLLWTLSVVSMASLGLTVCAEQSATRRRFGLLTAGAAILSLAYLLCVEFLIGLEAVRLFAIWYVARSRTKAPWPAQAWRALGHWLPYAAVMAAFLTWRVAVFSGTRSETDMGVVFSQVGQNPLSWLTNVVIETIRDGLETVLFAWFAPAHDRLAQAPAEVFAMSLLLALVAAALVLAYYWWFKRAAGQPAGDERSSAVDPPRSLLALGAIAVPVLLLPTIIAGRSVQLLTLSDRYVLPAMLGVSLLLAGVLFWSKPPVVRYLLVALLVGLSVGTHYANAGLYRADWQAQRNTWWQLAWRAPQLQAGTLIVVAREGGPLLNTADYEVWGAANLAYHYDERTTRIYGDYLTELVAPRLERAEQMTRELRTISFEKDYANSLIVVRSTETPCLHVLDGRQPELPDRSSSLLRRVASTSRLDLIETEATPVALPAEVFGPEPTHGWCYYYQRAQLARQRQDWAQVAALGDEARARGFKATEAIEWLPFVEGYARAGRCEEARDVARPVLTTGWSGDLTALLGDCRE